MKNSSIAAFGLVGMSALALGLAACGGGSFVGPPQGSSFGSRGTVPLIGATPLTFEPEIRELTGIAVDHWFLDPGQDTNEQVQGGGATPLADGINALADARFEEFVSGNATQQAPGMNEINNQYPMVISFLCQWFGRNPDNTRPQEIDVFGRQIWSESALDISFISGPVQEQRDMAGNLLSILMNPNFPNKDTPGGAINFPLKNWTSPPKGDGSQFPFPFQTFTANQFNTLGLIRFASVSSGVAGGGLGGSNGGGQSAGTTSLGAAIADNADNVNVESMLSLPRFDPITGLPVSVRNPLGVYSDSYGQTYRFAPLRQPPVSDPLAVPPVPPPKIDDPLLEDALIEFSRHMAAIHANLIGQAVGVAPGNQGTLMDPVMVQFVNGYQYRFHSDDVDQFSQQSLPGRGRDPQQGTGGTTN